MNVKKENRKYIRLKLKCIIEAQKKLKKEIEQLEKEAIELEKIYKDNL